MVRHGKNTEISRAETGDGDYGRIEARIVTVFHDIEWLSERHDWAGMTAIVMVDRLRKINRQSAAETRYYITSLALAAALIAPLVRSHRAIENSLHWVMDMVFHDDEARVRTDHAPTDFSTIKPMAATLIRRAPGQALHAPSPQGSRLGR